MLGLKQHACFSDVWTIEKRHRVKKVKITIGKDPLSLIEAWLEDVA